MRPFILLVALGRVVRGQLTQDTFNSIVGNAAEQAGVPECGVPCLLQAFEYSKLSRSCFVTSTSLSCLCDNEDIANGALSCASTVCGSTDTETFAERAGEICASRASEIGGSQTTLMTAASSKEVLSTVVNESTTMTTMVANEPTTTSSTPASSPDPTLKAQLDENKIDALTTAAKAGIGAGAGVLALIAILAAFLLIRKRKLDKNQQPLTVLPSGHEKGEQAELIGSPTPTDAGSKFTMSPMSEMGGGVFEKSDAKGMSGDGQAQGQWSELATSEPVELSASQSYGDLRQAAAAKGKMREGQGGVGRPQSGPIPAAEELYPSPQSRAP